MPKDACSLQSGAVQRALCSAGSPLPPSPVTPGLRGLLCVTEQLQDPTDPPVNAPEPREAELGSPLRLHPLEEPGEGKDHCKLPKSQIPPCSAPAQHHLVRDQPRPRGVEGTLGGSQQLPPCSWPTPRQSSEMDAAPPCPALPTRYLFKCSSRKRKVMRLGSGSERRRCIMQFSLAAGSERAGGEEREGSGQGPSPT